jgi:hypothetical protein
MDGRGYFSDLRNEFHGTHQPQQRLATLTEEELCIFLYPAKGNRHEAFSPRTAVVSALKGKFWK